MESREVGLTELGKELDRALDELTRPEEQIRFVRTRLLERATLSADGKLGLLWAMAWGRHRTAVVGALCGLSIALFALGVWMRIPISFEIGGTGVVAGTDVPIVADSSQSVSLQFSEGSSVVVGPTGRVRVLATTPNGAHVLLEDGAVDVAITHRQRWATAWRFDAGPVSVQVTGTRFRLAWNQRAQTFTIAVSEGSVVVAGSCLPNGKTVATGGHLDLDCSGIGDEQAPSRAGPSADVPSADEGSQPPTPGVAPTPESSAVGAVTSTAGPSPTEPGEKTWRELLAEGDLPRALAAAERAGFAQACATAKPGELLGLSDAARLAANVGEATLAAQTLRRRFPGTDSAAAAAFRLGRIAFERRGAYADAVKWFSTCLAEAPNGPFMGDAVGRLMEARQRSGDHSGARADAERYLERFPRGPYANLARRLLTAP